MFSLDDVLHATAVASSPVVVSAVHDTAAIRVEGVDEAVAAGVAAAEQTLAAAGGWDAAEYGITREAAAARLAAAQSPEARERVLADLRTRAIARAGLDTTGGRVAVMVAGQPAWHGLGVNVAAAVSAADAIRLAGLDWAVSIRPLAYRREDGTFTDAAGAFAVVRDDTQEFLGSVGGRYKPIQNADGFAFLDAVVGEFGAKFHTAGSIHNGTKVWMQCELPEHGFEVVRGDAVQAFATFSNPHDGSGKAWCFPTTNRVVCANTFRTASRDRADGLSIRHTGDVRRRVNDARQALGIAVREIDQFRASAETMAATPCDAPVFFDGLLDRVLDVTAAEARLGADALAALLDIDDAEREIRTRQYQREIDRRAATLDDLLARYESERCGVGGIRGTAWAAFNAVTEAADHRQPTRRIGTAQQQASRRFESVISGDADAVKQVAYEMLTAVRA